MSSATRCVYSDAIDKSNTISLDSRWKKRIREELVSMQQSMISLKNILKAY